MRALSEKGDGCVWWQVGILVLEQLHIGPMRFNQIQKALGISTKSLTDTLCHLEHEGIIHREVFPTVPVTVEYSLTEKGISFDNVLLAMKAWGQQWSDEEEKEAQSVG